MYMYIHVCLYAFTLYIQVVHVCMDYAHIHVVHTYVCTVYVCTELCTNVCHIYNV